MTSDQLRQVVREALEHLGLWSQVAENLVLGTAAHESMGFRYREQQGGPALSFWQVEPDTLDDLYENFLRYRPQLKAKLDTMLLPELGDRLEDQLRSNDKYAAAVCRLLYYRQPDRLPQDPEDVQAMAALWKKVYNTPLGKGTVAKFADDYNRYVA